MNYRIGIYRTTVRHGSVIETKQIAEVDCFEYPGDLQEIAEQYDGDFAIVETEDCIEELV